MREYHTLNPLRYGYRLEQRFRRWRKRLPFRLQQRRIARAYSSFDAGEVLKHCRRQPLYSIIVPVFRTEPTSFTSQHDTRDLVCRQMIQVGQPLTEFVSTQMCRHQLVVAGMLNHRPEDRLRMAGRLLKLGERFGPERLEAACRRALRFDDPAYMTIKHILQQGLDAQELPSTEPAPPAFTFVRTAAELVGHLVGGGSWR